MGSILRVVVTLALVAAAVVGGYSLWQHYMLAPWTRDARIRADVVVIAPDVSGWVVGLKVRDNQQVKAGDLLMTIDRDRYEAALEKARAVAETRASLGPQAISAELRENAQITADIARGEYRQAQADVKVAELNLARSEVRAPRSGQVTNLRLAQGNYASAGQPVMALVDDQSFYVQAYFEETKLPGIRVGAPVDIWLMSAGQPLKGTVESVSRGITDRNARTGNCSPTSSPPSTGYAWPSASRYGSNSTRCRMTYSSVRG